MRDWGRATQSSSRRDKTKTTIMTSGNLPSKSQIFISKVNCSVSHFLFFLTFVLSTMSPPNSTDGTDMINEDNGSVVFVSNKVTIEETIRNEQKKAGASVQCQTEQMKHMSLKSLCTLVRNQAEQKKSGASVQSQTEQMKVMSLESLVGKSSSSNSESSPAAVVVPMKTAPVA
jgi:hypothetical protein